MSTVPLRSAKSKYFITCKSAPLVKINSTYMKHWSDRVNLVAPASPIKCLLYSINVRAIQYKLGPEMLTRLGNSNVLRLPVIIDFIFQLVFNKCKLMQFPSFVNFSLFT